MKVIVIVLIAFILIGMAGKSLTRGYHCHQVTIANSQVCE